MAKSVLQKNWYEIVAPDVFDNEVISETPAEEGDSVIGRTVKISLNSLMPTSNKYYMDVFLKVRDIDGKKARTELVGHKTSKEYVSKMVRRRSDRIDHVFDVDTSDGKTVRVKLIGATLNKTHSSARTGIRDAMEDVVEEYASDSSFGRFMEQIFQNEIQRDLKDRCNKVYPLRSVEFRKTELLEA